MNTTAMEPLSSAELTPVGGGRLQIWDVGFTVLLALGAAFSVQRYGDFMDIYEKVILWSCVPSIAYLGWLWPALRPYLLGSAVLALLGISAYAGDIARTETNFVLKYFLSSQTAILWMSALFLMGCVSYWGGILTRGATALWAGSVMTWAACVMGFVGLLVRWYESYLISPDVGHIPVSNLYEVFVLFAVMTAMFYLYYEQRYRTRSMGAFVSLIIAAAVAFLLWYTATRSAH